MANLKLGVTIGGNVAIHSGNYNSYAPTLTGGNASGTWAISISGNSATTSQTNFSSLTIGGAAVATQAYVTSRGYLTSYTETDPYRVTSAAVTGTTTKTLTLTRADSSTVTATWTDYDSDSNTFVNAASFNTGNGILTLTRNDGGTVTVDLDDRYALAGSYLTAESDTLATVTSRGNVATGDVYVPAGTHFRARYSANDSYHSSLNWHGLQLGNNGDNYIIGGRTNAGGNLTFYVNNTSNFTSIDGVFAAKMHSTGRTSFGQNSDNGYQVQVYGSLYSSDWIRVAGSSGLYFESYGGGFRMTDSSWVRIYNDKNLYTAGVVQAAQFEDANDSNYYVNPASTSNIWRLQANDKYHYFGSSSNWDNGNLSGDNSVITNVHFQGHPDFWIGAGNTKWYTSAVGGHHDLLINTMQSGGSNTRGITVTASSNGGSVYRLGRWFAHSNQAGSYLQVDGSIKIGATSDSYITPTAKLHVTGSTSGADVFAVDGINGRLFTVSDDLSDSLFSVNTIAGLPVIEAFADNIVKIGPYAAPIVFSATGISTPSHGTSANWNTAYNKRPTGVAFSGSSTKTLTLTLGDGSTLTANFNDIDTDTNTDGQTLSINGSTLTISGGNSITLPAGGISQATADGLYQPLENQRLSTGNSPTFVDIYANEWFRNNQANEGLYNTATTMHWSSRENGYWDASSTNATSSIRFYTGGHVASLRGYVYANSSNEIGFLNSAGNWGLRMDNSYNVQIYGTLTVGSGTSSDIFMTDTDNTTRRIHCNSNRIGFLNSSNGWSAWSDNTGNWISDYGMYASAFYDGNDSNYYANPASNSRFAYLAINGIADPGYTRILNPDGGRYVTTTSTITGAIQIKLPTQGSAMMMTCTIKVYEYSTNRSFTMVAGGHRDGANWYNEFCYMDGGDNRANLTVRFGVADSRDCIWIGETDSTWSYPQVFVTDVQLGYAGYDDRWVSGWSVSFVTAFQTINRTQTAYQRANQNWVQAQGYLTSLPSHTHDDRYYTETEINNFSYWRNDEERRIKVLRFTGEGGDSANTTQSYAIYQAGGAWTHPYPDLRIAFHTGIQIGANTGYGGTRFYNEYDMVTELMSVGNGDNHVRVANNLYMGGNLVATQSWVGSQGYLTSLPSHNHDDRYYTESESDSRFAAASHSHAWTSITSKPAASNWNTNGNSIDVVVGMLSWKNYGDGHVIFDASRSTSPGGSAVSNTNPDNYWTGTYPTLMGWNGSNTYGVRVDVSRYSDSTGSVAWSNVSSRPTALSQFSNDLGNYGGWITSSGSISGNAATATSATQVVTIQDSAPGGAAGKLWWESDTGKLKVYYGSAWVDATPVPDMALYYAKAGGSITGDVTIQQTLTVVGNTLVQGVFTETSDISLKENIRPLESSLDKVMKLNGVSFNKKTTPHVKEIGFIAQEVEEVIPDLVTETNDGIKTVSYSRVSAILVETIKEQQAQIDELKEMVNTLTKKLNNQ